ncbi:dTDP-4-dehydrorhamnose reductase [Ahrensia kielensis]|uniref:dTDP-4-dehydrorhamnose reductase n=1 Tax=Ahrensia kielensis TaxID=76980 RepID=UPI00037335A3|nr:dTDP-4-dehydrorhamnose reductase [Ahrensia kielensis]
MRILLLGANGQLGCTLKRKLLCVGDVKACARAEVDLSDNASIKQAIEVYNPDCIVNAAAYTDVDKAENEQDLAFAVNAEAVSTISQEARRLDALYIHFSTDYVFDGRKKVPYTEIDFRNPINVYGRSKLAGENTILASGCRHFIFRTSWVIGPDGGNFARTILRLARERETLNVINDQYGVPTSTDLISKVTVEAIKSTNKNAWPSGIYHLVPKGQTTWYGIAIKLIQIASAENITLATNENSVYPILTSQYPMLAARPANSLLNTSKLDRALSFDLPQWSDDFYDVANQIIRSFKST